MSLELLSIALGVSTWADLLEGRDLVIWSDNSGAEAATRSGSTKQFDHNCIIHCIWLVAAKFGLSLFVERVPSELNIADLPSREEHDTLRAMGAVQPR